MQWRKLLQRDVRETPRVLILERPEQHPAFGPVPPGYCPVCKAPPDQPCDAGLHS